MPPFPIPHSITHPLTPSLAAKYANPHYALTDGELPMTKLHVTATIAITTLAFLWLIPPSFAPGQNAPQAAPTDLANTIISGWSKLPAGDTEVERAGREMAQAALNFWSGLSPE